MVLLGTESGKPEANQAKLADVVLHPGNVGAADEHRVEIFGFYLCIAAENGLINYRQQFIGPQFSKPALLSVRSPVWGAHSIDEYRFFHVLFSLTKQRLCTHCKGHIAFDFHGAGHKQVDRVGLPAH